MVLKGNCKIFEVLEHRSIFTHEAGNVVCDPVKLIPLAKLSKYNVDFGSSYNLLHAYYSFVYMKGKAGRIDI